MSTPHPSNNDRIDKCPKCGTPVKHAGGIGDFCPNKDCDVVDGLLGNVAVTRPKTDAARIAELERLLETTRQQYVDADHGARIWHREVMRLRVEATQTLAENAGLIQLADALKRDKADLHKQLAWHVENAKAQAEEIRRLSEGPLTRWVPVEHGYACGLHGSDPRECPYDKLTAEWKAWQEWHRIGADVARELVSGQHDLPRTRAEEMDAEYPRVRERDLPPAANTLALADNEERD